MADSRPHDTLHLESFPLHTEEPRWSKEAPEQVRASLERGAHVIGYTEVIHRHWAHGDIPKQIERLAKSHGYDFIHGSGDTAIAIKSDLKVLDKQPFVHASGGRGYTTVTFDFFGSVVTVFDSHWGTNKPAHHASRVEHTHHIIEAIKKASEGHNLAFYMGDCNPDGPLKAPNTFPRNEFDQAGLPTIYEDLDEWPAHVGVNIMGHARRDHRVQAKKVNVFADLGSDHHPVGAWYDIVRPHHPHAD